MPLFMQETLGLKAVVPSHNELGEIICTEYDSRGRRRRKRSFPCIREGDQKINAPSAAGEFGET